MPTLNPNFSCILVGLFVLIAPMPIYADPVSDLEALSWASESSEHGLALARDQTKRGQLLDALATIERVLLNFPDSDEAKLQHASLLCRLDDRAGSLVEFDALRGHNFDPKVWSEATRPCDSRKAGS